MSLGRQRRGQRKWGLTPAALPDSTNLGELIDSASESQRVDLLVDYKFLYRLKIPRKFRPQLETDPGIQEFLKTYSRFGSQSKARFFAPNFADVAEKVDQLHRSGIERCSVEQLSSFLLKENQKQTLKDPVSLAERVLSKGGLTRPGALRKHVCAREKQVLQPQLPHQA